MANLKQEDIKGIIEFFEKELNSLGRIPKVEKMKMRSRVVNELKPALSLANPRAKAIVELFEDKLSDGYTFKKKLRELIEKIKVTHLIVTQTGLDHAMLPSFCIIRA